MQQDNELKWEFAETGGGQEIGINDPVISNFLGDVATKLVREALQNSIDAGTAKPVHVTFDLIKSEASKIPGIERLRHIYSLCIDHWSQKNKHTSDILNRLVTQVQKNLTVSILKISDYNTRGLTPDDYHNLFQVIGGNSKGEGEGGSFGLGKGAYFGASMFRTVFVSSKYDTDKVYFAGQTRLVSFTTENGKVMQSSGTYGHAAQKPVTDERLIPEFFKREEVGTNFYIYGYLGEGIFKDEIIKAVLDNFWYAIVKDNLVVSVCGEVINHKTLKDLIIDYSIKLGSEKDIYNGSYPFFMAYDSSETKLIEEDLPTLGKVKFYVLKNEAYPKKIVFVRKTGMVIQKKGRNAPYGYAGVFVCENAEGNEILRKMENPEHNEWRDDIAIASGKLDKKVANAAMKELNGFIVSTLKDLQEKDEGDELRITELDKYLWLPMDDDEPLLSKGVSEGAKNQSDKESAVEIAVVDSKKLNVISKMEKLNIVRKHIKGKEGAESEKLFVPGDGGGGGHKKNEGIEDPDGDLNLKQVVEFKYKSFAELNEQGEYENTLIIKAPKSKKLARVVVRVGTDNSLDEVIFWSVIDRENGNKYNFEGSVIKNVDLDKNGNKTLSVQFEDGNKYSLNVVAYELK